jgi:adenylate cyclase
MCGGVEARTRLDFTGVGLAVNRVLALTKQLGRTMLLARAFADIVASDFVLERVDEYPGCAGFSETAELFAYHC